MSGHRRTFPVLILAPSRSCAAGDYENIDMI
jgi:hypothetical protein